MYRASSSIRVAPNPFPKYIESAWLPSSSPFQRFTFHSLEAHFLCSFWIHTCTPKITHRILVKCVRDIDCATYSDYINFIIVSKPKNDVALCKALYTSNCKEPSQILQWIVIDGPILHYSVNFKRLHIVLQIFQLIHDSVQLMSLMRFSKSKALKELVFMHELHCKFAQGSKCYILYFFSAN